MNRKTADDAESPILLAGTTPLARGRMRLIHVDPRDPGRLLKVYDDSRWQLETRGPRAALMRRFPSIRLRPLLREVAHYQELMLAQPDATPPIPRIFGFVRTDLGFALSVERIWYPGRGEQGRTLRSLLAKGPLSDTHLAQLNACLDALDAWNVVVSDLTSRNFVFGRRDGQACCVLVDGFGDYRALPLPSLFPSWNARVRARSCAALAGRIGLGWDARRRRFTA